MKFSPVVALDIGNVCITNDYDACARESGIDHFWHASMKNPEVRKLELAMERGEIEMNTFLKGFSQAVSLSPEKVFAAWTAVVGREIPGMAELVDQMLAYGLRPVFFSNLSWTHWTLCQREISFLDKMCGAVLSCDVHAIKP